MPQLPCGSSCSSGDSLASIDPTLSRQIVRGIRGAVTDVQSAVAAFLETNGVLQPVLPVRSADHTPVSIEWKFTAAGTPADVQLFSVPDGKVLQVIAIQMLNTSSNVSPIRDGVADGGRIIAQAGSGGLSLSWDARFPIRVDNGVRIDNGDQVATSVYRGLIVGYLEDKNSASATSNNNSTG